VRQIEELQNRVFILEDRLDSQRVTEQQRTAPALPVVKTLRAEPPPARMAEPRPVDPPPASSDLLPADSQVEYAGEAMQGAGPRHEQPRPVLRNTPGRPTLAAAPALRPVAVAPRRPTPVVAQKPSPVIAARQTPLVKPAPAAKVMPVVAVVPPPTPAPPPIAMPAPVVAPRPAPPPGPGAAPVGAAAVSAPRATAPPPVAAAPEPVAAREGSEWREPIPAEPLRLYRDALEALRAGHHAAALAGFRRFIDRNPVHDYADNAQYWIGECYYDLHQYQAATREFRAVIERYPHGNKVPDAMLKLAFSHLAMGQSGDGQQVLEALVRAYPKHTSAGLATARLSEPPFGFKANVSLGTIAPRPAVTR
jgi:tol-pal system protein YbgF